MNMRFSKTEVTGLVFLAVLIAAITVAAIMMKGCEGQNRDGKPIVIKVEEPRKANEDAEESSGRKKRKIKGGRKNGLKKKGSSGKNRKSQNPVEFRDPFLDTIPVVED